MARKKPVHVSRAPKLAWRIACALDATHAPALAYRGPVTMRTRATLAAWLDGSHAYHRSTLCRMVEHLEKVW